MFLAGLNEKEKGLFWLLANQLVIADGNFSEAEMDLLNQYQTELQVSFEVDTHRADNLQEIYAQLNNSPNRIKMIIYFELLGLAYSDSDFSNEEQVMLENIRDGLNLDREKCLVLAECIDEIYDTYAKISGVLNAE